MKRNADIKLFTKQSILYIVIFVLSLLYPFNFDFRINHAEWLGSENGIRFKDKGIIISQTTPVRLYEKLTRGNGLTLEAWVKTDDLMQNGPARILSYSIDSHSRNFTLAQSEDRLVVRLRTEQTDPNGILPHMELSHVFEAIEKNHIAVTYDFDKECVFINGTLRQCDHILKGSFSNWDPSSQLVIGNEASGDRPWIGEIYYAAIYDQALESREIAVKYNGGLSKAVCSKTNGGDSQPHPIVCYQFDEKEGDKVADNGAGNLEIYLHIPGRFSWEIKMLQGKQLDQMKNSIFNISVLLHILLFIPLGIFLRRFFGAKIESVFLTVSIILIIGIALSFGFEILQDFLPSRKSTIIDVMANLTGFCLGLAIAQFRLKRENR